MRHLFLLPFCLSFSLLGTSQDLHNGAVVLQILQASQNTYILQPLSEEIKGPDRSDFLLSNDFYRKDLDVPASVRTYQLSEEGLANLEKGEQAFSENEMEKARDFYLSVLKTDPNFFKVMPFIGQTFHPIEQGDLAANWYMEAIKNNPIDYLAYWLLGDLVYLEGDYEGALDLLLVAHLLNRNHPGILQSLQETLRKQKRKFRSINTAPQVLVDSVSPQEVRVAYDESWLGYAMTKALWDFEPGYATSMGSKQTSDSIKEEKECFLNMLQTATKKDLRRNKAIRLVQEVVEADLLEAYIMYEHLLPQYPHLGLQLPPDHLKKIREYVLTFRIW